MRDSSGDRLVVETEGSHISVICLDSNDDSVHASLSPKKARKLAQKLLDTADEIDGGSQIIDGGSQIRRAARIGAVYGAGVQIPRRVDNLEERLATLEAWGADREKVIGTLVNDQRWQSEQVKALLLDLGARREAYGEGTSEEPEPEPEPTNATPVSDEVHYLLPREWVTSSDRVLGRGHFVTFLVPNGTALADRISTGFSESVELDAVGLRGDIEALVRGRGWAGPTANTLANLIADLAKGRIR